MGEFTAFKLQKLLREHGILINFSGRFSQRVIEDLGEAVKQYLKTELSSQNETYNLFSVFIEQTQNIKNYCEERHTPEIAEQIENSGIVSIGKDETAYYVSSGNLIENEDAVKLRQKLEEILSFDKIGLKKAYKEQLRREPSESGSAGMGLLDMARRSSRPMQYQFEKIDEKMAFFTLKAYV